MKEVLQGEELCLAVETEGGRRPTGVSTAKATREVDVYLQPPASPDQEVIPKPRRKRSFTAAYKLKVLEELDACSPGERGALIRKKGLYSSHISKWRKLRAAGMLDGLTDNKRGRKPNPDTASKRQIAALEKQNAELQKKLKQAEMMIDIQKKVSEMFGMQLSSPMKDEDR